MANRICSKIDPNHCMHCCRRRLLKPNSLLARANYLTSTIVLVSLFTFTIAASSPQPLEKRNWQLDLRQVKITPPSDQPLSIERSSDLIKFEKAQQRQNLQDKSQNGHSNVGSQQKQGQQQQQQLEARPSGGSAVRVEQQDRVGRGDGAAYDSDDSIDANDEQFLQRLDLAARQLEAKLAALKKAKAEKAEKAARAAAAALIDNQIGSPYIYPVWLEPDDRANRYSQEPSDTEQQSVSANQLAAIAAAAAAAGQYNNNNGDDYEINNNNVRADNGPYYVTSGTLNGGNLKRPEPASFNAIELLNGPYYQPVSAPQQQLFDSNTYTDSTYSSPSSTRANYLVATNYPSSSASADDVYTGDSTQQIALMSNTNNANDPLTNYLTLLDKAQVTNDDDSLLSFNANKHLLANPARGIKRDTGTADQQEDDHHQTIKTDQNHQEGGNSNQQQQQKIRYTTLLEDEEKEEDSSEDKQESKDKAKEAASARLETATSKEDDSETGTTTVSYGKLVLSPSEAAGNDKSNRDISEEPSSIFGRLYSKLAEFMPTFLGGTEEPTTTTTTTTTAAATNSNVAQTGLSSSTESQGDLKQIGSKVTEAQALAADASARANDKNSKDNGNRIDDNADADANTNNDVVVNDDVDDDQDQDQDDQGAGGANSRQHAKPSVSKALLANGAGTGQQFEKQSSEQENDERNQSGTTTDSGGRGINTNNSNNSATNSSEQSGANRVQTSEEGPMGNDEVGVSTVSGSDDSEPAAAETAAAAAASIKDKLAKMIINLGLATSRNNGHTSGRLRGVEIDLGDGNRDGAMSSSKRLSLDRGDADELELDQMVPSLVGSGASQQQRPLEPIAATTASGTNGRGFNLMRDSNLMLPLGSSDEPDDDDNGRLLVRPSAGSEANQDSLLGKYIYAPTQHYYLNAMPSTPDHGHLGGHGYPGAGGNAFEPPRRAYAFQADRSLAGGASAIGAGGKSNDLYFLVMVGAFCVMAMAVVLSAGLFAYRVQQQRKTCQDTDYPTYGVVGPNNHNGGGGGGGGGGAASFVGGYFSHAGSQGSIGAGGKSVSAKHLAELYANADSGVQSIDKLSRTSTASTASLSHKKGGSNTNHDVCADQQQLGQGGGRAKGQCGLIGGHQHNNNNSAGGGGGNSGSSSNNNISGNFMAANQDAARMYHYQRQKQQMISSDRSSAGRHTSASDLDSEDENDDGSYTVYECPGLASAHEMEIKNPLFNDDQSP